MRWEIILNFLGGPNAITGSLDGKDRGERGRERDVREAGQSGAEKKDGHRGCEGGRWSRAKECEQPIEAARTKKMDFPESPVMRNILDF